MYNFYIKYLNTVISQNKKINLKIVEELKYTTCHSQPISFV